MVSVVGKVAPFNKRSLAMGLVAAAASFGQFAVIVPTMWMNKEFGWQTSLVVLASITISLLMLLPLLNTTNVAGTKKEEFKTTLKQTLIFSLKEKKLFIIDIRFFCMWLPCYFYSTASSYRFGLKRYLRGGCWMVTSNHRRSKYFWDNRVWLVGK